MGRIRSVRLFLLLIAVLILSISVTIESTGNGNTTMLFMLLGALYLGIGFFTASSYALFMDMTDVHLGATQFSAYMGVTNACEMWSALAVGQLVGGFGYAIAFAVMAAVSFAALPVLKRLSNSSKELLR
jgi:MFS family permease